MRTFVKTENGKYVDAAHISEINTSGSGGGTVTLSANPMEQYVVARAAQPEMGAYGTENTTEQEKESRLAQAGVLAENLIHTICRAEALAKRDGNGAVINFHPETSKWIITDLGKTAGSPAFSHP